jgi:hypothetical protein
VEHVRGLVTKRCEWFALCENVTDKVADHPILGPIPCCDRCAKVVGGTNYTPKSWTLRNAAFSPSAALEGPDHPANERNAMPRQTDVNGDPRYSVADTEYYTLRSTLEPGRGVIPVYAVEDTDDGYIAFTTDEDAAALIVRALDALTD